MTSRGEMTEERFGELVGSMADALAEKASPEEIELVLCRWQEARVLMPVALVIVQSINESIKEIRAALRA